MNWTNQIRNYIKIAGSLFIFSCLIACEKKVYDLVDPASSGVWTLFNTENGLPGNRVNDIKLGNDGNLWAAFSGNGAATYSNGVWTIYKTSNSAIINSDATSLGPVSGGSMIIGTADGLSLKTTNDEWVSYKDPMVTVMYVNTVKVTSNGWVWVGTNNHGFYYDDGTGFENINAPGYENVYIIEEDFKGNVWLGTDNGLLKWDGVNLSDLTTSNGLPGNVVTAIYPDSKQRLWIGTFGGETAAWIDNSGIHHLSLMNGKTETYITDIFEDRRGDIWFATWFDGLVRFDGAISHSFKEYNGFFENDVNSIGEDREGNLWFGLYSKGMVKYTLPLE